MDDLEKFTSESNDILERLFRETPIDIKTFDDFLKLPVNEDYKKNQEKKEIGIEESKNE
jgi:hypothetical protein